MENLTSIKQLLDPKYLLQLAKNILRNPRLMFEISFVRYLIIGFSTFFLDFGILKGLIFFADVNPLLANRISSFTALLYNFTLSNFWTFKAGSGGKLQKLWKYIVLAVANYFITIKVFDILVLKFSAGPGLAKVLVTAMVVSWNFFLYKLWIFTPEQKVAPEKSPANTTK